jgi:hypothetical protein
VSAGTPKLVRKGSRFGKWKVIEAGLRGADGNLAAMCTCDCGRTVRLVRYSALRRGRSQGCQRCGRKPVIPRPWRGWKFTRWTVITGEIIWLLGGKPAVMCRCNCRDRTERPVYLNSLYDGTSRSCGCLRRETAAKLVAGGISGWDKGGSAANTARLIEVNRSRAGRARVREQFTTHGLSRHSLYPVWKNMMDRCYVPGVVGYRNYGGRAEPVTVCKRWHDVAAFIEDIEAEIGPRPEGRHPSGRSLYTLDRIDNDLGYASGNVRWATAAEQRANQRPMIGLELAEMPDDTAWECGTCGEVLASLSAFDRHRREAHPRAS